jgi:hypothetical protein
VSWQVQLALVALVVVPLATTLHELAHAGAALLLGREPVIVRVGQGGGLVLRGRRLRLAWSPLGASGFCLHGHLSRDRELVVALAGPVASTAAAVVALWYAPRAGHDAEALLVALAVVCLFGGSVQVVPLFELASRGSGGSDGLQALCLIARKPLPTVATVGPAAMRRWRNVGALLLIAFIVMVCKLVHASTPGIIACNALLLQASVDVVLHRRHVSRCPCCSALRARNSRGHLAG